MSISSTMRDKPDTRGYTPELSLLGNNYVHVKGDIYAITGFGWDAERDLWLIEYRKDGEAQCFYRTPENFFGKHANGEARFRFVNNGRPKSTPRTFNGVPR